MRLTLPCLALLLTLSSCGPAPLAQNIDAPQALANEKATITPAPTPTPSPLPAPTPSPTPHIGIQVGHWQNDALPDEQAKLRTSTGNYYRGYNEWEVNLAIAQFVEQQLEEQGVAVDLLPATIPMSYTADAVVAIHADGTTTRPASRRGWKVTEPWRSPAASQALAQALAASYAEVTGIPRDPQEPSVNMQAYYAFAPYRYRYAVAPATPAAIIEVGFMTNAADREIIFRQPELTARGISQGILQYLAQRDPAATASQPSGLPMLRPAAEGVPMRHSPRPESGVIITVGLATPLVALEHRQGWYLVFTHGGPWEIGWVAEADVLVSADLPVPPES